MSTRGRARKVPSENAGTPRSPKTEEQRTGDEQTGKKPKAKKTLATKTTSTRKLTADPCNNPTIPGNDQREKSAENAKDIKVPDNALKGATAKTRGIPRKVPSENAGTSKSPKTEEQETVDEQSGKNSKAKIKVATKTTSTGKNATKACKSVNDQRVKSAESVEDVKVPDNALQGATAKTRGIPRKADENADTPEVKPSQCSLTRSPPKADETQSKGEVQAREMSEVKKKTTAKATKPKRPEETQETVNEEVDDPRNPTTATESDGASKSPEHAKNKILNDVLRTLTIKKDARSTSAKCVNEIQEHVLDYLKKNVNWCKNLDVLKTGSYYEHLKICEPDEFDIMLTVPVKRVDVQHFSKGAFYSVKLKRDPQSQLSEFLDDDFTIQASRMLQVFRNHVQKAIERLNHVTLPRKRKGCPAVTLEVQVEGKLLSIDFVLGLEIKDTEWPDCTNEGFNVKKWLGEKVWKTQQKGFYLVPKYEGNGNVTNNGVTARDVWRISFSHVEKYILKNHGNTSICCKEQKCCRKKCLKLLKYLLQQLKNKYPKQSEKLCSYHAKTALLHACAARAEDSEWTDSKLHHCFQQLLEDFEKYLRNLYLPNFFIPSQNLFNDLSENKKICDFLADCFANERETYTSFK